MMVLENPTLAFRGTARNDRELQAGLCPLVE